MYFSSLLKLYYHVSKVRFRIMESKIKNYYEKIHIIRISSMFFSTMIRIIIVKNNIK